MWTSFLKATFLLGIGLSVSSCTRDIQSDLSLNIQVPTSFSSLSSNLRLKTVIINMRKSISDTEVSQYEFEFRDNAPPEGSFVSLVVPGNKVPSSPNLFIQYLGVFEDNGMRFSYGATTANSNVTGAIIANINSQSFGTADGFGQVIGRYLPASPPYSGLTGPTGAVKTFFKPPVTSHPDILIEETQMIEGWFELIALPGIDLKHIVDDEASGIYNKLVFNRPVQLDSFGPSPGIGKIIVPQSFKSSSEFGGASNIESEGKVTHIYGYFADAASDVVPVYAPASRFACFDNGPAQRVPRLYKDAILSDPLVYDAVGTIEVEAVANLSYGQAVGTANCTLANIKSGSALAFNPDWISEGSEGPMGLRPPFRAINFKTDFRGRPEFLKVTVVENLGNAEAHLEWRSIQGFEVLSDAYYSIYIKNHSGAGSYSNYFDEDISCDAYANQNGYTQVQTDIPSSATNAEVVNNLQSIPLTFHTSPQTSVYNHSFLVCAYRDIAGIKRYYNNTAEASCFGSYCGNELHLGLAAPSAGLQNMTGPNVPGSVSREVTAVTLVGAETEISLAAAMLGVDIGDEIVIRLTGKGSDSDTCGRYGGNEINGPQHHFARVTQIIGAPARVYISSGSWVDGLSLATGFALPYNANNYCSAHVSKVPHFYDVTVTGTVSTNPFNFDSNWDGLIAFRSGGTLQFTPTGRFDVSARGYPGQAFGYGTAFSAGAGGFPGGTSQGGGGGAYASDGGDGALNAGTAGIMSAMGFGSDITLGMGAAGGGVNAQAGGSGGGSIFIAAKNIINDQTGFSLLSNGNNGTDNGGEGSGGGAGGSINIYSESLNGSQTLQLSARGGSGGNANHGGGGGGAGAYSSWFCPSPLLTSGIVPMADTNPGAGGTGTNFGNSGAAPMGNNIASAAFGCF